MKEAASTRPPVFLVVLAPFEADIEAGVDAETGGGDGGLGVRRVHVLPRHVQAAGDCVEILFGQTIGGEAALVDHGATAAAQDPGELAIGAVDTGHEPQDIFGPDQVDGAVIGR